MRKTQVFLLIGVLALAGCANNPYASNGTTADTGGGALLGALAGAVIGNQTGSPLAGAAIGAGVGGLAGYAVGHNRSQPQYQQPQSGYYAPPANNPPCPAGYVCTPNN
ncbi:MAG: glycine zipper domain-containing protein [Gammaproteobacteria bacterium]|jgi:uncharacterized membrane protein YebE (DUF533 family)|uniref:glycine zipper domain-containing protein n=1 Tax=Acidithiobacillus ferrooxidans TaxID=920 RepID=UPI0021479694|nr:glycine zipper domain-containing protein [Acidithiobacillus ferrooxidans]MCL4526464.1 glycine zipper domain-containing protein [Gammaproteobacteria bacterium]MCR1345284.1 glycine zipper domain-containing protein [Acidithiobacillus ferrooxidans]MCR1354444.1 glycine zipper domain-containing protein [Acidithiobacillus ferrooxidans]MDA8376771.1 glycine zipper domain-containing protein [Planctomycetia bacterium]